MSNLEETRQNWNWVPVKKEIKSVLKKKIWEVEHPGEKYPFSEEDENLEKNSDSLDLFNSSSSLLSSLENSLNPIKEFKLNNKYNVLKTVNCFKTINYSVSKEVKRCICQLIRKQMIQGQDREICFYLSALCVVRSIDSKSVIEIISEFITDTDEYIKIINRTYEKFYSNKKITGYKLFRILGNRKYYQLIKLLDSATGKINTSHIDFIENFTKLDSNSKIEQKTLRNYYLDYCKKLDVIPQSAIAFNRFLKYEYNLTACKIRKDWAWRGISVKTLTLATQR